LAAQHASRFGGREGLVELTGELSPELKESGRARLNFDRSGGVILKERGQVNA
jgi:hypothetical protein